MKKIIVTVTENGGHFSYDMELPTDIPMRLVQKDIIDNLSLLYPSFPFFRREWALVCERTGVSPDLESTAGESGVCLKRSIIFQMRNGFSIKPTISRCQLGRDRHRKP